MTPHFNGILMKRTPEEHLTRIEAILAHPNKTVEQRASALRAREIAQAMLKPRQPAASPSSPALPPSPPETA